MIEEWRPILSLPGYQASSLGRVKGPRCIRKPQLRPDGYYHITLVNPKTGKRSNFQVHRLVCEAFHGSQPFPNAMALHKDHVKTNCMQDNLYWGSHQNNMDDRVKANRSNRPIGEKNPRAKLNWNLVNQLRQKFKEGIPSKALAVEFGIDYTTCNKIVRNKLWIEV